LRRLLTADTLANSDIYYQDRFNAIREHFDPSSTVILSSNWEHVRYHLHEYEVAGVRDDSMMLHSSLPGNLAGADEAIGKPHNYVLSDPDLVNRLGPDVPIRRISLARGGVLHVASGFTQAPSGR